LTKQSSKLQISGKHLKYINKTHLYKAKV